MGKICRKWEGGLNGYARKGNRGNLANEVEEAFIDADAKDYEDMATDCYETHEQSSGVSNISAS
jgi:hypothetical protein